MARREHDQQSTSRRQRLFIGNAINYAVPRISAVGEGNRCLLGPAAAKLVKEAGYGLDGSHTISGKQHEATFECYEFDLSDVWRTGARAPGGGDLLGVSSRDLCFATLPERRLSNDRLSQV